jgi:heme-degrading monooxygenase HmoA
MESTSSTAKLGRKARPSFCYRMAGIKPLIEKAMGVQTLREDRADETEFITISYWESIEAMSRFTGGDPTRIHHLDRDPEFLIELPSGVQILRLLASHGNTGGDGPT